MQNVTSFAYYAIPCAGACFYQSTFQVDARPTPSSTCAPWARVEVFVNGRPLGRFWEIGPQGTLYLPAPWLKKGENEIVVFDLDGTARLNVPFLAQPVLDSGRR